MSDRSAVFVFDTTFVILVDLLLDRFLYYNALAAERFTIYRTASFLTAVSGCLYDGGLPDLDTAMVAIHMSPAEVYAKQENYIPDIVCFAGLCGNGRNYQ